MNTDTFSAQIQEKSTSEFSGVSSELSASANDIMNRTQIDDMCLFVHVNPWTPLIFMRTKPLKDDKDNHDERTA